MPFDGERFDTSGIIQLTISGSDVCPAWSPSGKYIAYNNTDCGSAVDPIPPNSCGTLIMDPEGNNKTFIIKRFRDPYWGRTDDTIYFGVYCYDLINRSLRRILDNNNLGFSIETRALFNPQNTKIFSLGKYTNVPGHVKLYSFEPSGENIKLVTDDPIETFTFTPDGRVVYLLYDYSRIYNEKGALWIMNQDGSNKQQLTFHQFVISYE